MIEDTSFVIDILRGDEEPVITRNRDQFEWVQGLDVVSY